MIYKFQLSCVRLANLANTIFLCGLRFYGATNPAFQAVSHIYFGFLLAVYIFSKKKIYFWLVTGMTITEVICTGWKLYECYIALSGPGGD